jgi:hypothetical protein
MQIFDITVPANSSFVVHAPGRYFKYMSGSNGGGDASLVVTPGMQGGTKVNLAPGQAYTHAASKPTPDSWTLANYSNTATIVGKVVVGDGKIDDPTIAGTVSIVDGGMARTISGAAFMALVYTGPSAANYSQSQLWNPAGSGKLVVIEQVKISSATGGFFGVRPSATKLGTAAGATPQPKYLGSGATCVAQGWTTQAATINNGAAGVLANTYIAANGNDTISFREPIVLQPNTGLLVNTGVNADVYATYEFYEQNQ